MNLANGLVGAAASRARMVMAFIVLSLVAGIFSYINLPKEGEPDIEIPALFVSVPFPGISARDSETLLVKPMETELSSLDGLKTLSGTAAEGYAGVAMEFEFGWDKTKIMADVREAMSSAEANFPEGSEKYSINEINFSEFPIIIVSLTGDVPERTMYRAVRDLQDRIEAMDAVLEAGIAGDRKEMVEVIIDPLRLEAYNVTAGELINVVRNNNQLIAAGEVEGETGAFAVKIPSSFSTTADLYSLPVKTNGDRVVTLGDLARISLTFEDRAGTARHNGAPAVALQVVKRKGYNLIDTANEVRAEVEKARADWPAPLRAAVHVSATNDQSRIVDSMVSQLEGSVLTAVALVMIVTLASLGLRATLLVGFAIPTSFLLCFALLAALGVTISNIVMFGLILAVGMLVDGAIVVVEYADKRISEGSGPMHAYIEAASRMFWPVISSTATTLCAFLPMLFWPGVPGQFMGMLPVTLIFVLSASLVVALIYLPVLGGVVGRTERWISGRIDAIAHGGWLAQLMVFPAGLIGVGLGVTLLAPRPNKGGTDLPGLLPAQIGETLAAMDSEAIWASVVPTFATVFGLALAALLVTAVAVVGAIAIIFGTIALVRRLWEGLIALVRRVFPKRENRINAGYHRSAFGRVIHALAGNPVMPIVTIATVFIAVGTIFIYYGKHNNGTEFFVENEPEQAIVYVMARGNLSVVEKDALVRKAETVVLGHPGIDNAFAFAGTGGLNSNTGGAQPPKDSIGQIQLETIPWNDRPTQRVPWFRIPFTDHIVSRDVKDNAMDGDTIIAELQAQLDQIPGIRTEILAGGMGPASVKPVHLRLRGDDMDQLLETVAKVRARYEATTGLTLIEDTRPLPGIDWQIDVDVEKAGRFGADVATVGAMVQLVTRGLLMDTMPVESSDEEIDIRVRFPAEDRLLATLDTLRVRTPGGLVPLANFITRKPVPSLAEINRVDQKRSFDIKAGVTTNLVTVIDSTGHDQGVMPQETAEDRFPDASRFIPVTSTSLIEGLTAWLEAEGTLPAEVSYEWAGDMADQAESAAFLQTAFSGALALMFIILLAQFNSVYNSILVLLAVILSTAGVLIGMLVMGQTFSIIMTGTGIVALAGIVVNNNIVLIDTYQEYSAYMPRTEAITRTAEDRIRPVLLTTITTMAGLMPMMFGLSLDFFGGGYSFDSPTALWWKQLATAVVFGLGIATVLTLVVTPSLLALRVWTGTYANWFSALMARLTSGRGSRARRDYRLDRAAARTGALSILWEEELSTTEEEAPAETASLDKDSSQILSPLAEPRNTPDISQEQPDPKDRNNSDINETTVRAAE